MDAQRWSALCQRLGCPRSEGWWEVLERAYSEPHRHYHTAGHVDECLDLFDETTERPEHPDEVELGIWLHDVVYAPRRDDNEERSAEIAGQWLQSCGADAEVLARVRDLILATRHAEAPATHDQALLQDIDLGILGASSERFVEYEAQIRREYRWVPGFVFRARRSEVLRSFVDRKSVYRTAWFRRHREAAARRNLSWAIDRLGVAGR